MSIVYTWIFASLKEYIQVLILAIFSLPQIPALCEDQRLTETGVRVNAKVHICKEKKSIGTSIFFVQTLL